MSCFCSHLNVSFGVQFLALKKEKITWQTSLAESPRLLFVWQNVLNQIRRHPTTETGQISAIDCRPDFDLQFIFHIYKYWLLTLEWPFYTMIIDQALIQSVGSI